MSMNPQALGRLQSFPAVAKAAGWPTGDPARVRRLWARGTVRQRARALPNLLGYAGTGNPTMLAGENQS